MSTIGLKQQILGAKSEEDIALLLKQGAGYDMASDTTRRSWKRAAKRRSASLRGVKLEVEVPVEEVEETTKKRVKKKKI